MTGTASPVVVYVTYRGTPEPRFARAYDVERHLPLVLAVWRAHGLEEVTAFFPAVLAAGTIAVCGCRFRDDAAVEAAFASPETPRVMADVARFTDAAPARARAVPVEGPSA